MNRLKGTRGYLCGAMDRVSDGGEGWRIALQKRLADLEVFWFDPTDKPIDVGIEDAALRAWINAQKQKGKYEEIVAPLKVIRGVDLRMVDVADFLVVNLDLEIHACGTYEELFLANREKKPIIVHVEQGKKSTPNWLFAAMPHELFFSTWMEVENYLRHVSSCETVEHYRRWTFFNYESGTNYENR